MAGVGSIAIIRSVHRHDATSDKTLTGGVILYLENSDRPAIDASLVRVYALLTGLLGEIRFLLEACPLSACYENRGRRPLCAYFYWHPPADRSQAAG